MTNYITSYLQEVQSIVSQLDSSQIKRLVSLIAETRQRGGRLFFLGSGGGAGHASHAVNDFRKIVGIEAYTPSDNVSELTAWINDDGWDYSYRNILQSSRLEANDMLFVFSVGGGDLAQNISPNLVHALKYGQEIGCTIGGVVGRDGGYTAQIADACVVIPTVNPENITPHTEAFQAVVWHLLVSHPMLKMMQTKWESTTCQEQPSS